MTQLGITKPIHLRGLHYALVSSPSLTKPNGLRYLNNADDWEWLQVEASKAARWLGYVLFDRIVDERNSPPVIMVHGNGVPEVEIGLGATIEVSVPDIEDIKPTVYLANFEARQKHRLVLSGEKTSLGDVVKPLCESYGADLYLPSGEITDSQLWLMAKTGAEDGRPMIVFVVADFDPAGNQMAVSIGRKLQAFRDLLFPGLEFEVVPIALTEDQVRELDLPSTPLKETERRADLWRLAHGGKLVRGAILGNGKLSSDAVVEGGLEQTEVDALATLRPDALRAIVVDAFDRYFDHSLDRRASEIRDDWLSEAQAVLDLEIDADLIAALQAEAEGRLAEIRPEIDRINDQLRTSTEVLDDVALPALPEPPEAELPEGGLPPLVSSAWGWAEQTRALIARKRYGNGSAGGEP
jgi:hypothetical protein